MRTRTDKGFTLIELIVVIAIIAILAAIIAPNAFKAIDKAKTARIITDMRSLRSGMLSYYADTGMWMPRPGQNDAMCPGGPSRPADCPYAFSVNSNSGDMGYMCNYCGLTGWDGPYLEKKIEYNPWGGYYHINVATGIARFYVTNIPETNRLKIDEMMDDGDPYNGHVTCYNWPNSTGLLFEWDH